MPGIVAQAVDVVTSLLVKLASIVSSPILLGVVGIMIASYLILTFMSWIDSLSWRRRYLPSRQRARFTRAGIRVRHRCWVLIEGSGYESHHERDPRDPAAQRRSRRCWGATCVNCGARYRDSIGEIAHFTSMAQATLEIWERGWIIAIGDVRCPACARFTDEVLRREKQSQVS